MLRQETDCKAPDCTSKPNWGRTFLKIPTPSGTDKCSSSIRLVGGSLARVWVTLRQPHLSWSILCTRSKFSAPMAGCPGTAIKALASLLLASACVSWWVSEPALIEVPALGSTGLDHHLIMWGSNCLFSLISPEGDWCEGQDGRGTRPCRNRHADVFKNWSIIALQCCGSFWRTKWISYMYTYIPSSWAFLPCPIPLL